MVVSYLTEAISFRAFWPTFQPEHSVVAHIVDEGARRASLPRSTRICVTSVFTGQGLVKRIGERLAARYNANAARTYNFKYDLRFLPPNPRADVNVWYTGENFRAPYSGYDLALSFDRNDASSTVPNVYFPYWMSIIDWGLGTRDADREFNPTPQLAQLPTSRYPTSTREGFCCIFARNREPSRFRLIEGLQSIGQVDCYGTAFGDAVGSKAEIASAYRFMLCPENDLYPGYVTEKLFEARLSGCVPLWAGIPGESALIEAGFVNWSAMDSDTFLRTVAHLNENETKRAEILAAPLLESVPTLEPTISAIAKAFAHI